MKTKALFIAAAIFASILTGCGGGGGGGGVVNPVITDIPSNQTADAYVAENLNTFALSAPVVGSGVIRVGYDPNVAPPLGTEYRGLLDFRLGGPGGVPLGATIVSATLDVVVDSREFFSPVPITIDMIDAEPPFQSNDYDVDLLPPLLTLAPSTTGFNVVGPGRYVLDITPLMERAQADSLSGLQLRLLIPLAEPLLGLVIINDFDLQPILTVEYF